MQLSGGALSQRPFNRRSESSASDFGTMQGLRGSQSASLPGVREGASFEHPQRTARQDVDVPAVR